MLFLCRDNFNVHILSAGSKIVEMDFFWGRWYSISMK